MRRTRLESAQSRKRIVKAAARLIREHGADQVSVAGVMKEANMTHGGFYVHFQDKDALLAEATKEAFTEKLEPIDDAAGSTRVEALRSYIDSYMTMEHVLDLGFGCPIAGLGLDASRATPAIQQAMSEGAERTIATFARDLTERRGDPRENAIRTLVSIVGSLVLARALKDLTLQQEVLHSMRQSEPLRSALRTKTTTRP